MPPGQRAGAAAVPAGRGLSLSDLAAATGGGGAGFAGVYDPHSQTGGGGRSLSSLAAAQESGGLRSAPPPGSEPADGGSTSRNAAKQKAKREAAKKKKEEGGAADAAADTAPTPPPPPPPSGGSADADDAEAIGKKIRNVEKKLRQIVELKELKAGGKPLEKNQLDKIEAEAAVRSELDGLQAKLTAKQEEGKWR